MVSPALCTAIMEGRERFGDAGGSGLGQPWQAAGPLAGPASQTRHDMGRMAGRQSGRCADGVTGVAVMFRLRARQRGHPPPP